MALACGEVAEGHPIAAADLRIQLMHCARIPIGRQPLRQCVWLEERAVNLIWPGSQNAVQMNSVGHDFSSFWLRRSICCGPYELLEAALRPGDLRHALQQ